MERLLIQQALERRQGNRKKAAADLGIDISTLYRKIQGLGIRPPRRDGRGQRRQ